MVAVFRRSRIATRIAADRSATPFAYLAGATAASVINSFIIALAFARLAGSSALGIYQTALAATGLIGFVAVSGSAGAATRAAAQDRPAAWPLFRRRIPYCLAGSAVSAAVAAYLVLRGADSAAAAFGALACTLPIFLGADVYPAHLLGRRQYHSYFKFQLAVQTTTVAGVLAALLVRPHDPWLALLAFTSLTGFLQLRGVLSLREGARAETRDFSYARGMSVVAVLGALSSRLDLLLVGSLLGARQAGLVAVARLFPALVKRAWEIPAPWFLTKMASGDGVDASTVANRYRIRVTGLLGAMAVLGIIAAPFAIPAFFGQDFAGAVTLTQLLLAAAAIGPFAFLDEVALRAVGDVRRLGLVYVVVPGVTLLSMPVLVLAFGILGVGMSAIASTATYVIVLRSFALLPRFRSEAA
jgi:O-antigen/teichoic acid export membrane protein